VKNLASIAVPIVPSFARREKEPTHHPLATYSAEASVQSNWDGGLQLKTILTRELVCWFENHLEWAKGV